MNSSGTEQFNQGVIQLYNAVTVSVLVEGAAFGEIAMSFFVACATVRGNWSDVGVPPFVAVAVLGAMPMSLPLTWQCLAKLQ